LSPRLDRDHGAELGVSKRREIPDSLPTKSTYRSLATDPDYWPAEDRDNDGIACES